MYNQLKFSLFSQLSIYAVIGTCETQIHLSSALYEEWQ